ncbi:MAG: HAD family phosphatase [Eubacteriales bacterium]|nr:HAD family phosphatase [Eubacteriales bacterium]
MNKTTDPAEIRLILSEKDAVIFDLDGTLVDSMWMWHQIDVEYLGRYGYECPELLQKEIEGMSFSETAVYFKETFQIPDTLEEIKQAWIDMSIEKYRNEVPLKKGVGRFLKYLKRRGIRAGIATSNGRDMVDAVLESLEIAPYFQVITTACEVAAGKPAPDIYLKVAETLGVLPERCMVFEDVPAGIQAGKAAGMVVCAVEDGYSSMMRAEKEALADYFIEDYDELLDN